MSVVEDRRPEGPVAAARAVLTVDELLAGVTGRTPLSSVDSKSGTAFERVDR
jgi:hypothetical protein